MAVFAQVTFGFPPRDQFSQKKSRSLSLKSRYVMYRSNDLA